MASFDSNLPAHEGAAHFLAQYARTRAVARFCRHLLWLLTLLGGVWLMIATLDWQASLTRPWRLAAALLLYSAVIGWNLRFMLPRRFRLPGWREAALRVEEQAPALQGRLLAACELPCEAELSRRDSLAFREELHREVSEILSQMQPRELVSWRGCRRPAVILLLLLLLWAGFSAVVSPAWAGRLWARAAAPWEPLPRIPGLAVTVESPQPRQAGQPIWIYAGESVRLRAKGNVAGVLRVTVEVRHADGSEKSWRMRQEDAQAFSTSLVMPNEVVEARVLADDAVSDWVRLEPARQLQVETLFYAAPETPKTKTTGAIQLTSPGEVSLEIHVNQPVKGQLELTQNGQKTVLPLEESADGVTRARFQVAASGSYTLRLEDAQTGLQMDVPAQPIDIEKKTETVKTPETDPALTQKSSEDEEWIPEEPYGKRVRAYRSLQREAGK